MKTRKLSWRTTMTTKSWSYQRLVYIPKREVQVMPKCRHLNPTRTKQQKRVRQQSRRSARDCWPNCTRDTVMKMFLGRPFLGTASTSFAATATLRAKKGQPPQRSCWRSMMLVNPNDILIVHACNVTVYTVQKRTQTVYTVQKRTRIW